ncbi:hypothetical protein KUCAC02_034987, partial [Chaenocephalus aceratus]
IPVCSSCRGRSHLSLVSGQFLAPSMDPYRSETPACSCPWGRCMGSDCGPGGSQSRAVWCAHSEGWTTLHTNCDQSKRPDNQQSCFRVCDWHKELYDWQLGAWNQCLPVSMRNAGVQRPIVCTRGEEGIQTREVGCVLKADGEPAEDAICEYFEPKPRLEQACLIPCPRDCVVSEFSPWTQCSKTCGMGLQNRIRFVLAPPLFGGSACPNLTEFHTCQPGNCEGEESLYSLRVGPWGLCSILVSRQARQADKPPREEGKPSKESEKPSKEGDKQSKEGDKPSRESEKTSKVGDKQSREGDKPSREGDKPSREGDKPSREGDKPSREGDKPSRQGVKVTGEGEKPSREGDRPRKDGEKRSKDADKPSRPNRKLGRANRKPDRPSRQADQPKRELIKKRRTKNRQNRPGGKFWDLTVGYQTREVSCVHKSGNVEALSLCSKDSLPITFQACVMTKDCDVTEWSDWSACSKECYDPNKPEGDRTRSRKVSQFPIDGGVDCPELLEKESCSAGEEVPPCIVYNWKSTEWTECRVDVLLSQQDRRRGNQTGLCGGGLQTREVYCVQTSSETPPNLAAIRSKEEARGLRSPAVSAVLRRHSCCLGAAVIPRLDLEFVINVRRHRANRFPLLASQTSPSGPETPEQARNIGLAKPPQDSIRAPLAAEAPGDSVGSVAKCWLQGEQRRHGEAEDNIAQPITAQCSDSEDAQRRTQSDNNNALERPQQNF